VAFSLIGIVPKKYLRFASSGIKDMTRIAASDSELWSDIFLSNPRNIANAIDLLQKTLSKIKSTINKRDKKLLALIIKEAKKRREAL
jgi:prephenate dehydrogenase